LNVHWTFAGGVSKQNNFGGLTLYEYSVRGFTTSEFYKDGFSANRGYPSTPDVANIERIEVLKGPAASLYGRGDPGGTVNIITKKPQPEAFTTLHTSAGSRDRYRTSLDVNTPLDDQGDVLSRINLAVEDNHSFRDHVDSKRVFVAPFDQLATEPGHHRCWWKAKSSATAPRLIAASLRRTTRWSGVSRSTFLGEPNDGNIDNHNNLLQADPRTSPQRQLEAAPGQSLQRRQTLGIRFGKSSALNADGHTVNRRYRERDTNWHDSITQVELRGLFDTRPLAARTADRHRIRKLPQERASHHHRRRPVCHRHLPADLRPAQTRRQTLRHRLLRKRRKPCAEPAGSDRLHRQTARA
jgi:iron complex outermembrane receptor protein